MPISPEFWSVELDIPVDLVAATEEMLGDEGVAVTSYEVPIPGQAISPKWRIQVLFDAPPDETEWRHRLTAIAEGLGLESPVITFSHVPAKDWVRHTNILNAPIHAGRFFLHGAHDAGKAPPGSLSLLLDAGLAFGTGRAPSTYGCLLAIDQICRVKPPRRMLDMGTGSGVLAMAAARAGVPQVLAADIDPVAVAVTRDNVRLNGLSQRVAAVTASRPDDPRLAVASGYDLVVANILAEPLCRMAPGLSRLVAANGHLVLSGLLAREERLVAAHYRAVGLKLKRRIAREGWHTLVLSRRP
ncbi:50S ribosomal protein L11 methyltransferase [uncultured Ferrovibrio sp.]|jgi:ribosomal protein L11 methyltransferase|uniref:50S ribosomal protein L11 methyltransferase n=1 Tax=uncultured Ferrovibrio sp. TaxID=1576913 RepID=UPI00260BA8F2|nr:50S ribosomal protein L11 methyltransferase [uncultured Ferrovibrio sp.]